MYFNELNRARVREIEKEWEIVRESIYFSPYFGLLQSILQITTELLHSIMLFFSYTMANKAMKTSSCVVNIRGNQ